jgi:hypothetical protein
MVPLTLALPLLFDLIENVIAPFLDSLADFAEELSANFAGGGGGGGGTVPSSALPRNG